MAAASRMTHILTHLTTAGAWISRSRVAMSECPGWDRAEYNLVTALIATEEALALVLVDKEGGAVMERSQSARRIRELREEQAAL